MLLRFPIVKRIRVLMLFINFLPFFNFPLTNTLEIYDNLETKDNTFKGGNGKEAYIEAEGL